MAKTNCKQCSLKCKTSDVFDCDKYLSKADEPERLKAEISEHYKKEEYTLARDKQRTLDEFNYGSMVGKK
jgi:hypothetical protein